MLVECLCGDVHPFSCKCLVSASRRGPGRPIQPPLALIPVGGSFHQVRVDVLQLPETRTGNHYVDSFLDYLTKWVKAFAIPDQKACTIARLFLESRHRVGKCRTILDDHQFLLLTYRSSVQESTRVSPFYLLYSRDLFLPKETILSAPTLCTLLIWRTTEAS